MRSILLLLFFLLFSVWAAGAGATFEQPRNLQYPSRQFAVAAADLNGDGLPDLIVGGEPVPQESAKIRVSLNSGNGNFLAPQEYVIGNHPTQFFSRLVQTISSADMNNDGKADIIVGHNGSVDVYNFSPLFVTILLGNGNGTLQPANALSFILVNDYTMLSGLSIVDLDNDGLKDIVIGCRARNLGQVYFVRNLGNGAFQPMGPRTIFGGEGLAVGRFNSDSSVDIAFSSVGDGIFLWFGSINFWTTPLPSAELAQGRDSFGEMVAGDFDNNGRDDLAAAEFESKRIRMLLRRRSSWPRFPVTVYSYPTRIFPDTLRRADIDGDGFEDLIMADGRTGGIDILYAVGNGEFRISESLIENLSASDLAVADLDNDGKADIITVNPSYTSPIQAQIYIQSSNRSGKVFSRSLSVHR